MIILSSLTLTSLQTYLTFFFAQKMNFWKQILAISFHIMKVNGDLEVTKKSP